MNMRIQLSLAISGREEQARKDASEVQRRLEALGHEVINPFELCEDVYIDEYMEEHAFPTKDGMQAYLWWECVKRCGDSLINEEIHALVVIQGGAVCDSAIGSEGVAIEINIACKRGIPILNEKLEIYK